MSNKRLPLALVVTLLGLAGTTVGACTAEESASLHRAPDPVPAARGPAPEQAAAPAQQPAQRPLDDAAVRALAEEVARLRAELADVTDELDQARAAGSAVEEPAPAGAGIPLVTPLGEDPPPTAAGAPADDEPVVGEELVVEEPFVDEPPVEREIIVEREIVADDAAWDDVTEPEIVVVQEEQPQVIYEQVVYEGDTVYQWVPYGHVHHIGCGHHYYGCSCHPWYYSCGGSGVAFHIASDDWYGWVGWGHPYSYYHFGYWHRDYDYDRWCGYRRDYYARHHHDGHVGDRKRAKRAYRQGYEDGFATGNDTPGRPGTRDAAAANDTPRVGGSREATVRTDARTRGGSTEGRSVVRGAPERPGGEVPGAARTSTRSQVPVVGADRSAAVTTFRSAAERERARREAAVRSTTGEVGRAGAPEIVRREGRASTTTRSREDFRRRVATPQDSSSRSTRDTVQRRTVTVPSTTTTRARERGDGGRRLATPDRSRSSSVPDRARPAGVPDRSRSIGIPDRSGSRREAPQRLAPTRSSAPSRAAPTRDRSSSPRSTTRTRGDRSGRRGLED